MSSTKLAPVTQTATQTAPATRARTLLLYGDSGTTKTSQLYFFTQWYLARNPTKIVRLISADGGGWAPFEDRGLIASGKVQAFDISKRVNALADVQRLAQGYWPYKGIGPDDFKFNDACKTTNADWERIGAYLIEGFSSLSSLWLNHIRDKVDLPDALRTSFSFEEDGWTVSGAQPGHYGLVQRELYSATVQGFSTLPVEYVWYTSLVDKGEDRRTKETVYGPKSAGHALVGELPSWVGDCLHLDIRKYKIRAPGGGLDTDGKPLAEEREGPVMWLWKHDDKFTGVPYLCKVRVLPEYVGELKKLYPFGWVPLDTVQGIGKWLDVMERFKGKVG